MFSKAFGPITIETFDVVLDLNGFTFATLPYRVKDILNHRSLGLQYMIFG